MKYKQKFIDFFIFVPKKAQHINCLCFGKLWIPRLPQKKTHTHDVLVVKSSQSVLCLTKITPLSLESDEKMSSFHSPGSRLVSGDEKSCCWWKKSCILEQTNYILHSFFFSELMPRSGYVSENFPANQVLKKNLCNFRSSKSGTTTTTTTTNTVWSWISSWIQMCHFLSFWVFPWRKWLKAPRHGATGMGRGGKPRGLWKVTQRNHVDIHPPRLT